MSLLKLLQSATSLRDLAVILGYKPKSLAYILYKIPSGSKYKSFDIPKRCGGVRTICAPEPRLKELQRRLANILYDCRHEIDVAKRLKPLSHGFRKQHSIITNARPHRRRRYVLNIDLQNFFPAFNFGRVRGFFIKNHNFLLDDKVATIIAQIACHANQLPQGSPCSPIISDLIAHPMDVRLAQLAKKKKLTYTRYADDLTFSTSRKVFPSAIAAPDEQNPTNWFVGPAINQVITKADFTVNTNKTRMQFRGSRQLVTGLTVNEKVNIRADYYRYARAMCRSVFNTGVYYKPPALAKASDKGSFHSLAPLEGILSHIHHVKTVGNPNVDDTTENSEQNHAPNSGYRLLYQRFLMYRFFVCPHQPLIVCEGKTDNVYISLAIRNLTQFQPRLGANSGKQFQSNISLFSYRNEAHKILNLFGSTTWLKPFIATYKDKLQRYPHRPLLHPVIILLDNDDGASEIFAMLRNKYGVTIDWKSSKIFYRITDNLYLIKTPESAGNGKSSIEDMFDQSLRDVRLDGKKFNPHKSHDANGEYGKHVFAESVVRPNAGTIDFTGFTPLLQRIVAVMDDYTPPRSTP